MSVTPQVQAFADRLDAATNKIAAVIRSLVDKINAGTPLTADDAALLEAEAVKLDGLGVDPTNPVPSA